MSSLYVSLDGKTIFPLRRLAATRRVGSTELPGGLRRGPAATFTTPPTTARGLTTSSAGSPLSPSARPAAARRKGHAGSQDAGPRKGDAATVAFQPPAAKRLRSTFCASVARRSRVRCMRRLGGQWLAAKLLADLLRCEFPDYPKEDGNQEKGKQTHCITHDNCERLVV